MTIDEIRRKRLAGSDENLPEILARQMTQKKVNWTSLGKEPLKHSGKKDGVRMAMTYSQDGIHLTESFESCRLTAYLDSVGVPTIGWGHTSGVKPGMTCTQAQADQWLQEDVQSSVNTVNSMVKVQLTQQEFDALVDFTFNLGSGNLQHSTLLRLLNAGNFSAAADEFDKWDRAGGQVMAGLLRRRQSEEDLFNA
jgi:lysozyme